NEGGVFARDPVSGSFVPDPDLPAQRLVLPGDPTEREKALSDDRLAAARNKEFVPVRAEDLGVDAPDPYTFRVRLRQPVPFLPGLFAHQFFRAVPRQAIEKYGDAWTNPEHIVTGAAFKVQSWKPYNELVIVRDPMYWDAAVVKLDRVSFFATENATTMM